MSRWNDQKGFSLVELIVVLAILAVLGTAIFGFFYTSINSYKMTGQETDLQYEAQRTMNLLDRLILNAIEDPVYVSTPTQKTLTIQHAKESYKVEWNQTTEEIILTKSPGLPTEDSSLMTENVKVFDVSLTPVVSFHLEYQFGKHKYTAEHDVTKRNKEPVSGNIVTEYTEELWWRVSSVDILYNGLVQHTAVPITITKTGSAQTIQLTAIVNGTNNPPQKVTWRIEGANDIANTKVVDTGTNTLARCDVILGATEDSENIKVYATTEVKSEEDLSNASTLIYLKMVSP